jgi:hypothetical protein
MALVLQPNGNGLPDDHHVMQGGWQVGRIYKRQDARRPESQWLWFISGIYGGPNGLRLTGMGGTLDEALTALKDTWSKLLMWAQLTTADTDAGPGRGPSVLSVVISKSESLACTPKLDSR